MIICPHCHGNSPDGWENCSRCGKPMHAPSIPGEYRRPQQAMQNEQHKFCPHCKTPAKLDAAQCGYCRYDYRAVPQQPTSNPSHLLPPAVCVNLPISNAPIVQQPAPTPAPQAPGYDPPLSGAPSTPLITLPARSDSSKVVFYTLVASLITLILTVSLCLHHTTEKTNMLTVYAPEAPSANGLPDGGGLFSAHPTPAITPTLHITNGGPVTTILILSDPGGNERYRIMTAPGEHSSREVSPGRYLVYVMSDDPTIHSNSGDAVFREHSSYDAVWAVGPDFGPIHLGD